ncbi:MAG: DEDD exonuclease domain-containing protein [Promicromonosporaceae bacterium]|nr:DEDD exonuclease domain-containing protein [Promicromonosporaceae bacterium]
MTTAGVIDTHWQPTFADLGTPLSEVTFVVVDLETTGTHAANAGITEIGAVKVRGGEILGEFQSLVNAGKTVSAFIARLTGITQAMVSTAPRIELVLPNFLQWAHDCVLVAHNAAFDVGFLKAACVELGYQWPGFKVVDTLALARRVVTRDEAPNRKLSTLAALFRAEVTPDHRALADARATVDVFHGILSRLGSLGVTHLEDLASASDAVPPEVRKKASLADGLPEAPGVYQFLGPNDEVLYVGTSNNLRKRVRSYFTAAEKRRQIQEMVRIAQKVNPIVCATPLEAAVRELRLIAEHAPRYNRRSKFPQKTCWVRLTEEAFPRPTVTRQVKGDVPHIGPFPSSAVAQEAIAAIHAAIPIRQCTQKLAKAARLPVSPCALAGLGRCSAPCLEPNSGAYEKVVAATHQAFSGDPSHVVSTLSTQIANYSAQERFEAAGLVTRRLKTFLNAAAKAQRLLPLAGCEELIAARPGSQGSWEVIIVKHGRLAGAINCAPHLDINAEIAALRATAEYVAPPIPPMPAATTEEAQLVLNWLDSPGVRLVYSATPWALPIKSALAHTDLKEVSAAIEAAV